MNHAERTTVKEAVAQNLLFYRKRNRMTQRELAEKLGVKHNSISSWKTGSTPLTLKFYPKFAIFLISRLMICFRRNKQRKSIIRNMSKIW